MNQPNKMDIVLSLYDDCVSCNEKLDAYDIDHNKIEIDLDLVETEFIKKQAEYDAQKYQRDRSTEYPELPEQLDMLFHAIDAGALDKTSAFYTTLKAVKDKYPKG